jgi:hypothetical protein
MDSALNQYDGKKIKLDLTFPTWKSLIHALMDRVAERNNVSAKMTQSEIENRLKQLDLVANSIENFHPVQIIEMLSEKGGEKFPQTTFDDLFEKFKKICIADNQFYTVYDIAAGKHIVIDPKIKQALGLTEVEFSLPAMAALDPTNKLYHPADVYHMIRWAGLSYILITFRGFKWNTLSDYYSVAHRVGVKRSSNEVLRKAEFVTLEKRCYPLFSNTKENRQIPIYHFDQWAVIDAYGFDYLRPKWITSSDQSDLMNGLFYLLNAYMLNVSTKYVAILNERMRFDRNKAVANSLNKKIKQYANLDANFDEIQIGNALSKTIRARLGQTMNTWDKRSSNELVEVESDQAAVHFGCTLGLIPMPKIVEELLYSGIVGIECEY